MQMEKRLLKIDRLKQQSSVLCKSITYCANKKVKRNGVIRAELGGKSSVK